MAVHTRPSGREARPSHFARTGRSSETTDRSFTPKNTSRLSDWTCRARRGRSLTFRQYLESEDAEERTNAAWDLAGARPVVAAVLERLLELSRSDPEERVRLAAAWSYSHLEAASERTGPTRAYDEPPQALHTTRPLPPKDAVAQRTGGDVVVEILISERGEVARAEVRQSVAGLDEAALECVDWSFAPARAEGRPVPSVALASVSFRAYR